MIPLQPNTHYKIRYTEGNVHSDGDVIYFQTLDKVPEAKHLIRVKNLTTGMIVDLVELLAHPWDDLTEHKGPVPGLNKSGSDLVKALFPFIIASVKLRTQVAPAG